MGKAGHAVVQALCGIFELHPIYDTVLPINLVFEKFADSSLGFLAEPVRDLITALFAHRVFEDALAAVVVLVHHPAICGEREELVAGFAGLEGAVGFDGFEPLRQAVHGKRISLGFLNGNRELFVGARVCGVVKSC